MTTANIEVVDKDGKHVDWLTKHTVRQMKGWLKARYCGRDYPLDPRVGTEGNMHYTYVLRLGTALPSKRWSRE